MTVCPTCFGPLYRRACLGEHGPRRRKTSKAAESAAYDHVLEWRAEYTTPKGLPCDTASWRPYRVTGPFAVQITIR